MVPGSRSAPTLSLLHVDPSTPPLRGYARDDTSRGACQSTEEAFDVLVTVDKGLRHQQNVGARDIAVIVLDAPGTTFADLLPLVPAAEAALRRAEPGTVTVVAR